LTLSFSCCRFSLLVDSTCLTNVFILFDIKYCDRSGWNSTTITEADGVHSTADDGRLTLLTDEQIDSIVRESNAGDDVMTMRMLKKKTWVIYIYMIYDIHILTFCCHCYLGYVTFI
jgi:hypothetical protein